MEWIAPWAAVAERHFDFWIDSLTVGHYAKNERCICERRIMTRQVCVQPPTAAVSVTLLAFAADHRAVVCRCCRALADRRPPRSIDISRPRGAQQQTRRTLLQCSIDGTDRQLTVTKTLLRMQAVITDFVSVEDNAIGRVSVRPSVRLHCISYLWTWFLHVHGSWP